MTDKENMRRLSPDEVFERLQFWYDDEQDTVVIESDSNVVYEYKQNIVMNSGEHILFYSDHENNKKIMMNTGSYDSSLSVSDNITVAINEYKERMHELAIMQEKINKMIDEVERPDDGSCKDCST